MPGIEVTLTDEQLKNVMGEAILAQMDDAMRASVIRQAITYLTTEQKGSSSYYGQRTSPLQDAFNRALGQLANEIVRTYVQENDAFRTAIKGIVEQAATEALTMNQELRKSITEAVAHEIVTWHQKAND